MLDPVRGVPVAAHSVGARSPIALIGAAIYRRGGDRRIKRAYLGTRSHWPGRGCSLTCLFPLASAPAVYRPVMCRPDHTLLKLTILFRCALEPRRRQHVEQPSGRSHSPACLARCHDGPAGSPTDGVFVCPVGLVGGSSRRSARHHPAGGCPTCPGVPKRNPAGAKLNDGAEFREEVVPRGRNDSINLTQDAGFAIGQSMSPRETLSADEPERPYCFARSLSTM